MARLSDPLTPPQSVSVGARLVEAAAAFVTAILSFALLVFVGQGEAGRTYPKFQLDKLISQGEVVQTALERYVASGLPLRQYPGFRTTTAHVETDPGIAAVAAFDPNGRLVFENGVEGVPLLPLIEAAEGKKAEIRGDETYLQVTLPLHSRFGVVGSLAVTAPRAKITERVDQATANLPIAALAASACFALVAFAIAGWPAARRGRAMKTAYGLAFFSVAALVVTMLINLYADGAQARAKALAYSLSQRLTAVFELGVDLQDLEGLDRAFADYRALNPDIAAIALTSRGTAIIHTDGNSIGKTLVDRDDVYEFVQEVESAATSVQASVYVALPRDVVLRQVGRAVKNFAVLFVASGFMAALFFQLGAALRGLKSERGAAPNPDSALEAIKPALFIAFFVENLAVSFLPQLMQRSAAEAGLPPTLASMMFMTYFLCFAAALVPSGIYAAKRGAKPLIVFGVILVAAGALVLASSEQALMVVLSRVLSGFGQGMAFIGAQSYILAFARPEKKTQSAAIIVFTFNGGMLSGMTIGGLLFNFIDSSGVFMLGAAASICVGLYALLLLPKSAATPKSAQIQSGGDSILKVFRSWGFLSTTMLVGIPAKAVLTGVIVFAMPLVLDGMNLAQEDIGQVIMFYALGVLIASHYSARIADQFGRTDRILFWGAVVSGLGLTIIGAVGAEPVRALGLSPLLLTLLLLAGVLVVGFAHGCINAPVITHIANSSAAQRLGEAPVTAFYRFVERLGHVAGPLVVGQLFFFADKSPIIIAWVGGAIMVMALMFALRGAD